jgi:hypothetical protein
LAARSGPLAQNETVPGRYDWKTIGLDRSAATDAADCSRRFLIRSHFYFDDRFEWLGGIEERFSRTLAVPEPRADRGAETPGDASK